MFKVIRKASCAGGSLQITLPAIWVKHHKLGKGSGILMFLNDDGTLKLEAKNEN